MPSVCRVLQIVSGHLAARTPPLLSQGGAGQDICWHEGMGFKEQSHRPAQRARLFLKKTRSIAGVATGWDVVGIVLQPTGLWGLNRSHLPKVQLSHKCLQ